MALMALGLVVSIAKLRGALQDLARVDLQRSTTLALAAELRQSSDDLTRMARSYAATGDPRFRDHYYRILAIRDGKVPRPVTYGRIYWDFVTSTHRLPEVPDGPALPLDERMRQAGFTPAEFALLQEAHNRSDHLVQLEEKAFAAMAGTPGGPPGGLKPDAALAQSLLFGEAYHQAKASIMAPVDQFLESIDRRTRIATQEAQARASRQFKMTVALLLGVALLALTLAVQAYRLDGFLLKALEREVDARTKELTRANGKLEQSLAEVRTLQGLLPICSWCKKVRDEEGLWTQIEAYVAEHSDAHFTHGICPDCRRTELSE
jgi:methyl-accepting chemotaxis protein